MSKADCAAFYQLLSIDRDLREEAMQLKNIHHDQEKLMTAFILMAKRNQFFFTMEELAEYIFENSKDEK